MGSTTDNLILFVPKEIHWLYIAIMKKIISSPQNSLVKNVLHLQEKSRNRRREGKFVVEGIRELKLALLAHYRIQQLFYCPDLIEEKNLHFIQEHHSNAIVVTEEVYRKIAYRSSTEGAVAILKSKSHDLKQITLPKAPFILVAEAPEKPGNIGALLRTADAAGVDAVMIANPKTDMYNPNIIRSSVGGVFTNQIATGTTTEIIKFLKENHIKIFCATLQSAKAYTAENYKGPTAIVVGTEAVGLSSEWRESSTQNIIIPMNGAIDSMNVSVSAGILLFEVRKQRESH